MSVLVTGAGTGIGAAIARRLGRAGQAVAVTDLDGGAAEQVAADIEGAAAWHLDVTDGAAVARVAAEAEQRLGPLTGWVSNAGISSMARFADVSEADLDAHLAVNVKGVFLCGQVAARHLEANGGGRIVNTASMAGKQGGVPFLSHYVASKFAVVGLTQAMAYELAPAGITVNCVCPGFVATGMQERELAWEAALRGTDADRVRRMWVEATPLGRLETPEDVAAVVAFLLGDDAAFVTGEALSVNGGAFMD